MGLCTVTPNARELGDWLGVHPDNALFYFDQGVRQVPCESHVVGVAGDRYASRMHSLSRTLFSMIQRYSPKKPTLIYVSSRKQTILTTQDLVRLADVDEKKNIFTTGTTGTDGAVAKALREVSDPGLRRYLASGIGICHESMVPRDQEAVEVLYRCGHIQILVATFAVAKRLRVPSHLVIVKGTEVYHQKQRRYEDAPVADILHMIGQAGRPDVDSVCYSVVFVHEPKKTLFKKFLHEPLPVESSLRKHLAEVLLREVTAKRVKTFRDAVEFVTHCFLFQRLKTNPGFYGLEIKKPKRSTRYESESSPDVRLAWISRKVAEAFKSLLEAKCITLSEMRVGRTFQGNLCSAHGLHFSAIHLLYQKLSVCEGFQDVFGALFSSKEVSQLLSSYDDDKSWATLSETVCKRFCDVKFFNTMEIAAKTLGIVRCFESEEKRSKTICYGLLVGLKSEISGLGVDAELLHRTAEKLVAVAFDIAVQIGRLSPVLHILAISQALYQGLPPTDDFWELSGSAKEAISVQGRESGFASMDDILNNESNFIRFLARNSAHEGQRNRINKWLGRYPRLSVSARIDNSVERTVTVEIHVKRKFAASREGAGTFSAVSPKRTGGYAVIIGGIDKNAVYAARRVADVMTEDSVVSVPLQLGRQAEEATQLHVWVVSDVFLGVEAKARLPM